jgi:hypothetical protein
MRLITESASEWLFLLKNWILMVILREGMVYVLEMIAEIVGQLPEV